MLLILNSKEERQNYFAGYHELNFAMHFLWKCQDSIVEKRTPETWRHCGYRVSKIIQSTHKTQWRTADAQRANDNLFFFGDVG